MAKGDTFKDPLDVRLVNGELVINKSLNQDKQLAFYRIRLNKPSNFTAQLIGLRKDQNADLTLFDPDTNELFKSDNEDNKSELIQTLLKPGTYIVRVNRIDGDPKFQLKLFANTDAGNSFDKATKVPVQKGQLRGSFVLSNGVTPGDRNDFYQITLATRSRLDVVLGNLRNDADLTLFDPRFRRIGISTNDDTQSESISRVVGPGTYYVRVSLSNKPIADDDGDDNEDDEDNDTERSTNYKLKIGFINA